MPIDVKALVNNIYFIAKEKGIKIGELEIKAGTTPGYLSRFLKDGTNSTPNLDVIAEIAKELDISIDNLIYDLPFYSKNVSFWIDTIHKIINETRNGEIEWECQTVDMIKRMVKEMDSLEIVSTHPLFEIVEHDNSYYIGYYSRYTGESSLRYYNVYKYKKGDNTFYFAKFLSGDRFDVINYELYCVNSDKRIIKVCNAYGKKSCDELLKTMEILYETCFYSSRFPKITSDARKVLDDLFKK